MNAMPPSGDVNAARTACVQQAAAAYGAEPDAVWREIALRNGRTGEIRRLPDGNYEIGLLRIPSNALPALQQYGVSPERLLNDECLNIQVGTYMLRLRQLAEKPKDAEPPAPPMAWAGDFPAGNGRRGACMVRAAVEYRLPLELLRAIAKTEGGDTGTVSRNSNGSVDMGVMQVNSVHLSSPPHNFLARGVSRDQLINDDCVNIAAAASILRYEIDRAPDFWTGVARYHSHTKTHGTRYLGQVVGYLRQMAAAP